MVYFCTTVCNVCVRSNNENRHGRRSRLINRSFFSHYKLIISTIVLSIKYICVLPVCFTFEFIFVFVFVFSHSLILSPIFFLSCNSEQLAALAAPYHVKFFLTAIVLYSYSCALAIIRTIMLCVYFYLICDRLVVKRICDECG